MGRPYAKLYLLHLFRMHRIKYIGEIYEQNCRLKIFARNPTIIRWLVRIGEFVDRFLRKPLWFFPRIFPTSCRAQLRSRAVVLSDSVVAFFGKRRIQLLSFFYCILFIDSVAISKKYFIKFLSLPYFRKYFVKACSFSVISFSSSASSSSSLNCTSLMSSWQLIIFGWVYQWFQEGFQPDFWNDLTTAEVLLFVWQFLVWLSGGFSICVLHLLSPG